MLPCILGRGLKNRESDFFERSMLPAQNAQGSNRGGKTRQPGKGGKHMLPNSAIPIDGGVDMSGFGSDLCPGEPCSLSLDHDFYASECEEQPPVPFNTLDSDYSEKPLFSLDPDYVAIATSSWEESPLPSSPVADRVQISPPEAKDQFGIETSAVVSLPSPPPSQQCLGPKHLEEPVSSPQSLLHLYLTRKSRRVLAAPQTTTPVIDGCLLPQAPVEQLPPTSSSIGVASTSSYNQVLCYVESVKDVSTSDECRLDGDNDIGNLGDGRECEEDVVGCFPSVQGGPRPVDCPATMQQVSASSEGLNTHASTVPRGPMSKMQKASVANCSSRSVKRAKFYCGEAVPQSPQPLLRREDGWRCPRAHKRQKEGRQSRLDGWLVEGSHQA